MTRIRCAAVEDRVGSRTQDAEFVWGLPQPDGLFCPQLPFRHHAFVLDAGDGFFSPTPVSTLDEPEDLSVNNRYEYLVTRVNGDGPLSAAIRDSNFDDNSGSLRVRIRPLRERDCLDGAWEDFDDSFADEDDCLDHVP